jgi:Carboxypeptidase regulatory-like domain/Carbohydrate-selective porin, OprB family
VKRFFLCSLEKASCALRRAAFLAVLLAGFCAVASAAPTETMSGIVKDASGVVMAGVTVHLSNPATGAALSAVTDTAGHYRFDNLAQGAWEVSFAGIGFETGRKAVQIAEESTVFNATLAADASPAPQQDAPMPNMPGMSAAPAQAPDLNNELTEAQVADPKALLAYIQALEQRIADLESSAVLSEPETRTKRIEVYVDANSNEYDHPVPGAKKVVTYQRERVYRRQTINEKIEEALSAEGEKSVALGVSAAIMPTGSLQASGPSQPADGKVYDLASADISFAARVAQNTTFYADLVGLTGPTPDREVNGLTLLNSYTARLSTQNAINLREAWLRTELFKQSLAISAGRLDLTSYFDRNAVANDETSQFLSDALVNNPTLGLFSNGAGVSVVYDPKRTFNFKLGFQQNDQTVLNLSKSIVTLAEVGYFARPFGLQGGNYRVWLRTDNSLGDRKDAAGLSFDQKLTDHAAIFGRVGFGYVVTNPSVGNGNMWFYSGGTQMQKRFVLFPGDTWGAGYALTYMTSGAAREHLGELYYSFQLTERLSFSPRIQYVREINATTGATSYVLPGVRLQAAF